VKKYNNENKLGNKGFTLVEVIVCMAIIAIAFLPMLRYFSDSLKYTLKSRRMQTAELVAQAELEEMKSYQTLKALKDAYTGQGYTVSEVTNAAGVSTGAIKITKEVMRELNTYFVEMEVTPDTSYENTEVDIVDTSRDVVAVEGNEGADAVSYFEEKNIAACNAAPESSPLTPLSKSEIQSKMARRIVILAEGGIGANADKVTVSVTYYYYLKSSIDGVIGLSGTALENAIDSNDGTVYKKTLASKTATKTDMAKSGIWLFYNLPTPTSFGGRVDEELYCTFLNWNTTDKVANQIHIVAQNKDELAAQSAIYELKVNNGTEGLASGRMAKQEFSNVTLNPMSTGLGLVTTKSNYSRISDVKILVYKNAADMAAGESEALATLNGVYEGGTEE
jgi:prepilin-type N-terminal cleavage/methylation domain-containing protein